MTAAIRNRAARALGALFRGAAYAALVAKLLVPVGYMPSALGDGGPITLCDAGLPPGFVTRPDAPARGVADAAPIALPADAAAGTGGHDEHAAGHARPAEGHGQNDAGHGPWERCSLGALASLAALASHWPEPSPSPTADERPGWKNETLAERSVAVARARGPPASRR